MALLSVPFNNILGLQTETSPIATPPNTMFDCLNVSLYREGYVTSRKGHPIVIGCGDTGLDASATLIDVHSAYRTVDASNTTDTSNHIYVTYTLGGNTNFVWIKGDGTVVPYATSAYARIFYYSGTPTAGIRSVSGGANPTVNAAFRRLPRWGNQFNRATFSLADGVYVENLNSNSTTTGAANTGRSFKKFTPLVTKTLTGDVNVNATITSENWLQSGYKVRFVALLREYVSDTASVESAPSAPVEVWNIGPSCRVEIDGTFSTYNQQDLSKVYLEVYRTIQYQPYTSAEVPVAAAPPTEYRLCFAAPLSDAVKFSTTNAVTSIVDDKIYLTLNDDALISQQLLYTDVNAEGVSATNCLPPAAKDECDYKGYRIYGGCYIPPWASLSLTRMPGATTLTVAGTAGGVYPILTNSTSAPATTGIMDATSMQFKGGATAYNFMIRSTLLSTVATGFYGAKAYASTSTTISYLGSASAKTQDMLVVPDPNFDINKFAAPGVMALVNSSFQVIDVISYRDVEAVPGSNQIQFFECSSIAQFAVTGGVGTVITIFALPGAVAAEGALTSLPIYPVGTVTSGEQRFSLVPTYETYPTVPYIQFPVGMAKNLSYASSRILGDISFFGIGWKSDVRRLDESAEQFVNSFNNARAATDQVVARKGVGIGEVAFESINVGPATATIPAKLSGATANTGEFSEPLTTSDLNIQEQVIYKNALILSKLNRPCAIARRYIQAPILIGREDKWIQRVESNDDCLYVFKEDEGIYRVTLTEGQTTPEVSGVVQLDNTIWCVAPESVCSVRGAIFFISNKGPMVISGGRISPVGREVETEIKSAVATELNAAGSTVYEKSLGIVGWGNELRGQWNIYFPAQGYAYTYNIAATGGYWTKRAHLPGNGATTLATALTPVISAFCDPQGRMFSVSRTTNGAYVVRADAQTTTKGNLYAGDQYDEKVMLDDSAYTHSFAVVPKLTLTTNTAPAYRSAQILKRNWLGDTVVDRKVFYVRGSMMWQLTWDSNGASSSTWVFDTTTANAIPTDVAAGDYLVVGVEASVTMNRFFAGGAGTITQFSEYHAQVPGIHTGLKLGFETDRPTPDFSTSAFVTMDPVYDLARTVVPQEQKRGRWCMVRMTHNTPFEFLQFAGMNWVCKDLKTFRVANRS